MQGTWNHDRAHYRCRFPNEYAIANRIDHPLAVYVREDAVLGPVEQPAKVNAAAARNADATRRREWCLMVIVFIIAPSLL